MSRALQEPSGRQRSAWAARAPGRETDRRIGESRERKAWIGGSSIELDQLRTDVEELRTMGALESEGIVDHAVVVLVSTNEFHIGVAILGEVSNNSNKYK